MQVEWTNRALDDIEKLDRQMSRRIFVAVDTYAETRYGDVKKLAGSRDHYRLRVGRYRVRFTHDDRGGIQILLVLRVQPRDRAYRD